MAVFGGITASNVTTGAQARLMALRLALEGCEDFYQWLSAYSQSDLEAAPLSLPAGDAEDLLSAFADAHQEYMMHNGEAGFPTAQLPYNFSASQRVIIGPQF